MARKLRRTALVKYSPEQMFDLVNDIERYPEYIPHCLGAKILERDDAQVKAELAVGKGALRYEFATENTLVKPESIHLRLLSGPFKKFNGVWQFNAAANGTEIIFELEFEFSSRLLNMTAGKLMEQMASQQVDVICQRAERVYRDE